MLGLYRRWIDAWERKLANQDTNRLVRPFEWGLDWLECSAENGNAAQCVGAYVKKAVLNSGDFFSYKIPSVYNLDGLHLTFASPLASPHPENNSVHADFFPAVNDRGRAVLVLPQWNADASGHAGLCKLLNHFGLTALRMSLAYHDRRMPKELKRADYHVSSNIGRTIHASRQSVMDARACLDWLELRGYQRFAILGTSLGSCIAFITAAHDGRVRTGVFNHVSMYFSDVVWDGLSTQHVRRGFGDAITQDELREYWSVISPATYMDRLIGRELRSLLIWAKYDSTFLPAYSLEVLRSFRARKLSHEVLNLPCGHYTTGQFPFNLIDGVAMCRFLQKNL